MAPRPVARERAPQPSDERRARGPRPTVAFAPTPSGQGYWIADEAGAVVAYGDARRHGSATKLDLDAPIIDLVPTATGNGYWLLAADGGIFSFGDAHFFGSPAQFDVRVPVVQMAATPGGQGSWVLARDGEIFHFGDARFLGGGGCVASEAAGGRTTVIE